MAPELRFAAKQLANGRVPASDLGAKGPPETEEAHWRRTIAAEIGALLPLLQYVTFPILVDGVYDVTPDHLPILGRVGDEHRLRVAAGLSGHGFIIAPAVGRIVADAPAGRHVALLDHFSPDPFGRDAIVPETQVV